MKTLRTTHIYRVLQSSWGIWISITAAANISDPGDHAHAPATARGHLIFDTALDALPPHYREALQDGWTRVEPRISERLNQHVDVTVEDITFVDTDFQVEGLPVAIVRWAEDAFDLTPLPLEVTFDRAASRYHFAWT